MALQASDAKLRPLRPAVFVDRDGVINENARDSGYIYRPADFRVLPRVASALRDLKDAGFLLVVVTNQAGIGKGLYSERDFHALTEHMLYILHQDGIPLIDAENVFCCPHVPNDRCKCRKPEPGMFIEAAKKLNVDLARSFMVGDKVSDLQASRRARVPFGILVRSGEPLSEHDGSERIADVVLDDLWEASRWILERIAGSPPRPRSSPLAAGQTPVQMSATSVAPLRIGLAGGGTDVPPFSTDQGGAIVNVTISLFVRVKVTLMPAGSPSTFIANDLGESVSVDDPVDLLSIPDHSMPCALLRAAYRRFLLLFGQSSPIPCRIQVSSDVPPRSGLGGSSSILVALIGAFAGLFGIPITPGQVASLACEIERIDLGLAGGVQDAWSAAFGGINLFLVKESVDQWTLPFHEAVFKGLERDLILFLLPTTSRSKDTVHHALNLPDGSEEIEEQRTQAFLDMKAAALDLARAIEADDWDGAKQAIVRSWNAKSGTSAADSAGTAISTALQTGALAAKVCGAGGGGFLVVLCGTGQREKVAAAIEAAAPGGRIVPFQVELKGATAELLDPEP